MLKEIKEAQVVAIVDTFFGDSGKGKIDDHFASLSDGDKYYFSTNYRPNGGPNTGHSVYVNGKKYVFHLVPSGVVNRGVSGVIGRAVSFDPRVFFNELDMLTRAGISDPKIYVDYGSHVIMPYHILLDILREETSDGKIGTTKRGVGPCIETRDSRYGFVTVDMLLDRNRLEENVTDAARRIQAELSDLMNKFRSDGNGLGNLWDKYLTSFVGDVGERKLGDYFKQGVIDIRRIVDDYFALGSMLEIYIDDGVNLVRNRVKNGERILVEGTQGFFLDITHGDYPYVTAGLTTRAGLEHDAGIDFDSVVNVVKAYGTRVGSGHFVTEIEDEDLAERLRKAGNEYGATTGRPRRVGWLDGVALRYALEHNSRRGERKIIALTKLDVLSGFEPKICSEYNIDGRTTRKYESRDIKRAKAVSFMELSEIESINEIERFDDLPINAKRYVDMVQEISGGEVLLIGNGQNREDLIVRD